MELPVRARIACNNNLELVRKCDALIMDGYIINFVTSGESRVVVGCFDIDCLIKD